MLWNLLKAGAMALAASFCLGGLLLYGLGGLRSPYISWVIWISIFSFCAFWLVFAILTPQPPIRDIDGGESMEG